MSSLKSKISGSVTKFLGLLLLGVAAHADAPPVKTFTFRLSAEPATLDWNRAYTTSETYVLMNLMEGLVAFDANLKPIPALAESWTISPDGKTYTFKIRSGVKWSDGIPLRAQDFVYSWKRLLSPVTAASYAYTLFDIEGAEDYNSGKLRDFSQVGIQAIDPNTLQVKLVKPVAHWIDIPTFWVTFPLREDLVEKYGDRWDTPGRMVTVGPFTLESHDTDSQIVLRANPGYYGAHGNIDKVVALVVTDDSTAINLYETNHLDFLADISTVDLVRLSGHPELKTFPYLKTGYLGLVSSAFPMSSAKFRRAIAMAIDKSKIASILHGGQTAATAWVPPKLLGYAPKAGLSFDLIEAKRELRESGVDLSLPVSLDLAMENRDKTLVLAQYIQEELKKNLGLSVTLQPFDHKTFRSQLELHAYPLFENSWSADYPDPDNFFSVFLSGSGNNRTAWKSPRYDQLVLDARYSQNAKTRQTDYLEAQKILIEDEAVVVPLYYEPNLALIRARVKGLELNPLNYLLLKNVNLE
jgi:oligopeptide transport system substrate-binding protein